VQAGGMHCFLTFTWVEKDAINTLTVAAFLCSGIYMEVICKRIRKMDLQNAVNFVEQKRNLIEMDRLSSILYNESPSMDVLAEVAKY
jgi:hypothetical protein